MSQTSPCIICSKPAVSQGYCRCHALAYENLREAYPKWQKAYGELKWERYLDTISKLQETGRCAIEVAKQQLKLTHEHTYFTAEDQLTLEGQGEGQEPTWE